VGPFAGPVGPVAPVFTALPRPVGPVLPVGPVCPVAPVFTAVPRPVGPVLPVGPVAPVFTAVPRPVGPVFPVGPVSPVAPVFAASPVAPVGPVCPVGPVSPSVMGNWASLPEELTVTTFGYSMMGKLRISSFIVHLLMAAIFALNEFKDLSLFCKKLIYYCILNFIKILLNYYKIQ
jgi:hypothetical protein